MTNEPVLEFREVTKSFGGVRALDRVSITFPPGRLTSIIGPNAAGKTTTFNVVGGFVRRDAGEIFYKARSLHRMPPYAIARLGVGRLFQESRVFGKMTVIENVAVANRPGCIESAVTGAFWPIFGRAIEGRNLRRAYDHLRFVGLADDSHRLAEHLSYGQQRRLAIARLLHNDADCLLLDEPTAGLQPDAADAILDIVRAIADTGKTVVMIEHDLRAVQRVSDWVCVMREGRIAAPASLAAVFNSATAPRTPVY